MGLYVAQMNKSLVLSASLLLCSNLIALACAIWFRWNLFEIVILYWIQALFIGFSHRLKVRNMVAYAKHPSRKKWLGMHESRLMIDGIENGFLGIYGVFWMGEGILLLVKFLRAENMTISLTAVVLTSVAFLVSHWSSYQANKPNDQRRAININNTLAWPLFRMLLPLHFFSVAVDFEGPFNAGAIATWMAVKTGIDVYIHISEHSPKNPMVPAV